MSIKPPVSLTTAHSVRHTIGALAATKAGRENPTDSRRTMRHHRRIFYACHPMAAVCAGHGSSLAVPLSTVSHPRVFSRHPIAVRSDLDGSYQYSRSHP
jgi:hypothetical protein